MGVSGENSHTDRLSGKQACLNDYSLTPTSRDSQPLQLASAVARCVCKTCGRSIPKDIGRRIGDNHGRLEGCKECVTDDHSGAKIENDAVAHRIARRRKHGRTV